MKVNVIIPCGGSGSRMGLNYNKIFADLGGTSVIKKTLDAFNRNDVAKIIIPCTPKDREQLSETTCLFDKQIILCDGGATRSQSVINALSFVDDDCDYIAIHDGARPFVSQKVIDDAFNTALQHNSGVACVPVIDSLRKIQGDLSISVNRNDYYSVQTPQVFEKNSLLKAYKLADTDKYYPSDDAQVYEKYIAPVHISQGSYDNIKVTTPSDIANTLPQGFRVGTGWDTHMLVEGRKLILGGVLIPHSKGLLGHSDADVLVHAVMDAVLGALAKRDIGILFPDNDNTYKDIDSMLLLKKVIQLMHSEGYTLNNLSAVILAQKPKLAGHIPAMVQNLSEAFGVSKEQINISATTTEKLGMVGREEGISSSAYCSLVKIKQ